MAEKIVFKLCKVRSVEEAIKAGVPYLNKSVLNKSQWDSALVFQILHQREKTRRKTGERALWREVIVGRGSDSVIVELRSSNTSYISAGISTVTINLRGGREESNRSPLVLFVSNKDLLDKFYLNVLTAMYAWATMGCFESRDNLRVPEQVNPDTLTRFEGDPNCFIM